MKTPCIYRIENSLDDTSNTYRTRPRLTRVMVDQSIFEKREDDVGIFRTFQGIIKGPTLSVHRDNNSTRVVAINVTMDFVLSIWKVDH